MHPGPGRGAASAHRPVHLRRDAGSRPGRHRVDVGDRAAGGTDGLDVERRLARRHAAHLPLCWSPRGTEGSGTGDGALSQAAGRGVPGAGTPPRTRRHRPTGRPSEGDRVSDPFRYGRHRTAAHRSRTGAGSPRAARQRRRPGTRATTGVVTSASSVTPAMPGRSARHRGGRAGPSADQPRQRHAENVAPQRPLPGGSPLEGVARRPLAVGCSTWNIQAASVSIADRGRVRRETLISAQRRAPSPMPWPCAEAVPSEPALEAPTRPPHLWLPVSERAEVAASTSRTPGGVERG